MSQNVSLFFWNNSIGHREMDFYDGNINSSTRLKLDFSVVYRKKAVKLLSKHFKVLSSNFSAA